MPTYVRPPVTEAFLEFRFRDEIPESKLIKCRNKAKKLYPSLRDEFTIPTIEFKISSDGEVQTRTAEKPKRCYRLTTYDASNILSLQPSVIWFGTLAPYQGWNSFFGYVKNYWPLFTSTAGKKAIQRLGCRYVNRIDIPTTSDIKSIDISKYLNVSISGTVDLKIDGFNNVLVLQLPKDYKALMRFASAEPAIPNTAALLLDIDIYKENLGLLSNDAVFEELVQMQKAKNKLFEDVVTDASRTLFNKEK